MHQSLQTQLDSLKTAGVTRIFSEKISTRVTRRPELERAVTLAREMRASGVAVTLVVHEHKRLGRGLALAELGSSSRRPHSLAHPASGVFTQPRKILPKHPASYSLARPTAVHRFLNPGIDAAAGLLGSEVEVETPPPTSTSTAEPRCAAHGFLRLDAQNRLSVRKSPDVEGDLP